MHCNEKLEVKVNGLLHYATFRKFYKDIPFELFGREDKTLDWMLNGVLGIKIEKIAVYSV